MGVAELIDQGIRLYTAGRLREARELFQLAMDLDPGNPKARAYLVSLREAGPAAKPPGAGAVPAGTGRAPATNASAAPKGLGETAPIPPPAPAGAVGPASPPAEVDAGSAPVRLPAPVDGGAPPPDPAAARALADPAPGGDGEYVPSPWDEGPAASATIELEPSGGLDLEAVAEKSDLRPLVPEGVGSPVAAPMNDVDVWLSAAKELFALGDFSGSLELIEKILQVDPEHGEARDYLQQNEATLVSMYESKLGPLARIPRLAIKPEEVMWLTLDHRAGFLLAQIDGTVDFETLFALSGLPRLDTARILANLIADGVITS